MDKRIIISANAQERLRAHGRAHLCEQREVHGVMERERRHGRRERSPIHDTEVLLLQQGQRLYVMPLERLPAGHDFTGAKDARAVEHPDIADTSNGPGDISERGEILGANKERGEKKEKKNGVRLRARWTRGKPGMERTARRGDAPT